MSSAIRVSIVFNSTGKICEASCGLDWNNPENINVARKRAQERFGDSVKLELLDVADNQESLASIKKMLKERNLILPLLLINDEVRIAGEFDIRQLIDAIEVVKEINGQ